MTVFQTNWKAVFLLDLTSFEEKNMGRRLLNIVLTGVLGWAAAGCFGITEISGPEKEEDIWTGPGVSVGGDSESICYVTGIDYPEGFDWRESNGEESVRCSLTVFADAVPMLKLPIGKLYKVSADPDMHRILEGHLYTEFCSEGHTVIRKDGKAFLRYEGEESIRGMVASGEDIYTLGVPRSGAGFTYRKNGEVLMERRSGYVFDRLAIDEEAVCFAFCQPVTTTTGSSDRYYIVRNERISMVEFADETTWVWDIMSCNGKTCAAVSAGPWNTLTLISGNEERTVLMPFGAEMTSCRLFSSGDDICIEGLYTNADGTLSSGIWVEGEEYMFFETGQTISAVCSSETDICCVLNPSEGNHAGIIFKNGKAHPMPAGYICTGSAPIAVHQGTLYAALTSQTANRPLLWENGKTDSLKLNGPLCSISICTPR